VPEDPIVGVAVLLAARNGAPWLPDQLDSLLAQDCPGFSIHISDDASTDGTRAVLRRYQARFPEIINVHYQEEPLGCGENFRFLIRSVEAAVYFLCDQDDWWEPRKIGLLRSALASVPAGKPGMAFSDLQVCDDGLAPLHPSLWALQRTPPSIAGDLRKLYVCNVVTGCAMAFNRAARDLVLDIPYEPCHDHAIAIRLASAGAAILPIAEPLVRYRQHGANAIGARPFFGSYAARLKNLWSGRGGPLVRAAMREGLFRSPLEFLLFKLRLRLERALWYQEASLNE